MTIQIPLKDWPLGLEEDALLLALLPTEIERRASIRFSKDRDELDEFEGAILDLDGHHVALQYYPNSPISGTNVIRRAGDDVAIEELTQLLRLKPSEIHWQAPNARRGWSIGTMLAAAAATAFAGLQVAVLRRAHHKTMRSGGEAKKATHQG